jgi:hypothetical protein
MRRTKVSITREPDSRGIDARVSLGKPTGMDGFYIVFRGEPDKVIQLLSDALIVAEHSLPRGQYIDERKV